MTDSRNLDDKSNIVTLSDLDTYYKERTLRARELKESGKKVIGYFCCFVPLEILTALDLVPYRLQGSVIEPIDCADAYLEPISCPFIRSCLDLALKGRYDFLDGFIVPHTCDTIEKIYDIWKYYQRPQYCHFINIPHMLMPDSYEFFKNELRSFIISLQAFTGQRITRERLQHAIRIHNDNRSILRQLYELRMTEPPLVSGIEVAKALFAGMGMPAIEHSVLLSSFIDEVKGRSQSNGNRLPRIFIHGGEVDDIAFIKLVEDSGACVVMDDLCTGSRTFWQDVEITEDPLDGIVGKYLGINCPRSYIPQGETRQADLDNRFGYLYDSIRNFKVDGVILYVLRYCDTYELEAPAIREYLRDKDIPVLILEDDYSMSTIGQLRTRIQAFLEIVSQKFDR